MQSVSSKIWTRVAVSISYDDNHYTTGTSNTYTLNICDLVGLGFMAYQPLLVINAKSSFYISIKYMIL